MYKPLYTLATCLIKCSICFTFLRLSTSPKIRRSLHWILYIVSGSSLVMFIGSFVYCVPYPAIWKHWQHPHTPGYCLPGAVVLTVGYSFACVTIATDLACAIIPGVILWQTVMSTRNMCLAWGILGLGFLAGIMTACRLPYIAYWVHTSNQSCKSISPSPQVIIDQHLTRYRRSRKDFALRTARVRTRHFCIMRTSTQAMGLGLHDVLQFVFTSFLALDNNPLNLGPFSKQPQRCGKGHRRTQRNTSSL
jgi:hypothetical protein